MLHRYTFYLDYYSGGMRLSQHGKYCLASEVIGPGTWFWACKQMEAGRIVCHLSDTGAAKYKMSTDGQFRIEYTFKSAPLPTDWTNANIFLSDITCTDWVIWNE